jgi:O-acetyl-ADP-ribose deacetylase
MEHLGGTRRIAEHPEVLASADLETICKLLTVCARRDRFCEGHFGVVIENGEMLAIVRRLAEIHQFSQRGET